MHQTNNFFGQSGFYHFFGIVEDRNDPENHGRLRVRCYGVHTANKAELPTSHLPWAQVLLPVDAPANSVPNAWEGDMVFGFFADGVSMQVPVIMGILSAKSTPMDPMSGFSDPREAGVVGVPGEEAGTYNGQEGPRVSGVASGKGYAGYSKTAKTAKKGIIGPGGSAHEELESPYDAKYPYNHASVTESGHMIEWDDTPGAERVHVLHRSGSFVEMHPDGSLVIKATNESNIITIGNSLVYVNGDQITVVDGSTDIKSGSNYNMEVTEGNLDINVLSGDVSVNINGSCNVNVTGDCNVTASNISLTAGSISLNG